MSQTRVSESGGEGPVFVSYREVQATETKHDKVTDNDKISGILKVTDGFSRQSGSHSLDELSLKPNPSMFVEGLLDGYPSITERDRSVLMNDFSGALMTSARQKGKYVILIVSTGSVLICHADSKEKTITKQGDVIERLLDTDNVDKYVEFRRTQPGKVDVQHYERSQSKSMAKWLGLSRGEVAYKSAGDVRIFTQIQGETCAFEFNRDEFVEKFLESSNTYELTGRGVFETGKQDYPVEQIQFGRKNFDNVGEFLQEFYSLYYSVHAYREHFNEIANSVEPYEAKLFDHRDKITIGASGQTRVRKQHDSLSITFASKQIELHNGWAVDLCQKFKEGEEVGVYHAGMPLSKDPVSVGSLRLFNDIGIADTKGIDELYSLAEGARMDNFADVLCYIILEITESQSETPVSHFFGQLAERFSNRLEPEGLVMNDETNVLEFKSGDWFVGDEEKIAEELVGETQGEVKLLIGGIEDGDPKFKPLNSSRFTGERCQRLKSKVESLDGNCEEINIKPVPLNSEECLLFVYVTREKQSFTLEGIAP